MHSWGPLATVCAVLLLLTGSTWPRTSTSSFTSTAKALVDPASATYDGFDPARASLKLVQVVFRHGARTPLNTLYTFQGTNWTKCRDHYQGVEVQLYDEYGGQQAPPILDEDEPVLPGGCRQGTLTEAGYGLALDLGSQLRSRYVEGGSGPTAGFLPDLAAGSGPRGAGAAGDVGVGGWDASVASLRTTPIRRTVATLRGVLTGMWPRLAEEGTTVQADRKHEHERHQQKRRELQAATTALPVGASVEPLEIMYGNNRTCARLAPLHDAMARDLEAADARNADLPRLNRLVAEALDLDPSQAIAWPKLYDTLAAMIADRQPLPPGATQEVLDIIWAQAEFHEAAIIGPGSDICGALGPGGGGGGGPGPGPGGDDGDADSALARRRRCQEVLRLGIGMLVRRLLDNMEHHVATAAATGAAGAATAEPAAAAAATGRHLRTARGEASALTAAEHGGLEEEAAGVEEGQGTALGSPRPPSSRFLLFSGHDSSVTPLLAVLGQPARAWPPFTANLIFELWQAASDGEGQAGERAAAVGRRGLQAGAGHGSESASAASGSAPEFWVRILYNGSPLVVPGVSNTGGWSPLGILRQRVLLPYAIAPPEHAAVCAREDISDLELPQPPATRVGGRAGAGIGARAARVEEAAGGLGGRSSRRAALTAREREIRHAML